MTWCFLPDTASLCSGGGGLDMGLDLAEPGFLPPPASSSGRIPRSVLIAAQRAGYFAPAPIWDNVKTFDGRPWRGLCDTEACRIPMPAVSAAGQRKGEDDPRHLLAGRCQDRRRGSAGGVFLENVPGHVSLGLETVLRTLWDMGFTPAVGLFSASKSARRMKGSGLHRGPPQRPTASLQTAEDPTPGQTGGTTLAGATEDKWATPTLVSTREGWTAEELETRREEVRRETLAKGNTTPATASD